MIRTQKKDEEAENAIPTKSVNSEDYKSVHGALYCKTCATQFVLHRCSCGKEGTEEYIDAHIAERHAKGTQSAISAHQRLGRDGTVESKELPKAKKTLLDKLKGGQQ